MVYISSHVAPLFYFKVGRVRRRGEQVKTNLADKTHVLRGKHPYGQVTDKVEKYQLLVMSARQ